MGVGSGGDGALTGVAEYSGGGMVGRDAAVGGATVGILAIAGSAGGGNGLAIGGEAADAAGGSIEATGETALVHTVVRLFSAAGFAPSGTFAAGGNDGGTNASVAPAGTLAGAVVDVAGGIAA